MASWDGRHRLLNSRIPRRTLATARPQTPQQFHAAPSLAVPASSPQERVSPHPIAFMRPERFASSVAPPVQRTPEFEVEAREQSRKSSQTATSPERSTPLFGDLKVVLAEQKFAAQVEVLLAQKCEEFSGRLESRLESFYEQTASRLDMLSEEIVRQFCETLNQQMTEALSALMADRAEQNRALVDAECHAALDRFAARLERISSTRLEGHRKEIQVLSINLKARLRGVAHALEELGPHYHA